MLKTYYQHKMSLIKTQIFSRRAIFREGLESILIKYDQILLQNNNNNELENCELLIIDLKNILIEEIQKIKNQNSNLKILVISYYDSFNDELNEINNYINGYLTNECNQDDILKAVKSIIKNQKFYSPNIIDVIIQNQSKTKKNNELHTTLTQRENQIVKLFTEGFASKEIAEKLFLSNHTVNTHRKNILKKLKIKSTTELILYAIKNKPQ